MTRILTDGAESGDMSRINASASASTVSSVNKRTGTYAYDMGVNDASFLEILFNAAATEWYARFAFNRGTANGSFTFGFRNGGATSFRIRSNGINTQTASFLYDDGTTNRGTTSTFALNAGEWHVVEVHVKHAASPNGRIEIKFDGRQIANFSGDVVAQAQTDRFYPSHLFNPSHTYFDDIAVNSASGIIDNSWVGDGGVLSARVPIATGTYAGFLVSGSTSTWQATDEIPANSTDFMYSSVSGTSTVLVMSPLSGLPAGASISRVWAELYAKETAAAGDSIATLLHSGVTNVTGTAQNLTTVFARYISPEYLTNPDTSGTWSVTDVNSIQIGAIAE